MREINLNSTEGNLRYLFYQYFSRIVQQEIYQKRAISFEFDEKPIQAQEILVIEVSFKVSQITSFDRYIFNLFLRDMVKSFLKIERPNTEILPNEPKSLRARFIFLAGHCKSMITTSRNFFFQILSDCNEISEYAASRDKNQKFPDAKASFEDMVYFFHPIIKNHLQSNPDIMFLFSQHFRIPIPRNSFETIDHLHQSFQINLEKQSNIFIAGIKNPIFIFYFGFLFDLSLRQKNFQVNWKKIFSLMIKTLQPERIGIDPHENKFSFDYNFLTKNCVSQTQIDSSSKTARVCPFLDRPNFLALQKIIYQYLQARREISKIPAPGKDPKSLLLAGRFLDCESIDFHPLEKNPFLNPICPLDSNTPRIPFPPFARVE